MTATKDGPLVSVGMPLYNAERYLPLAIESLVNQDYPNIEIIFCDDASTDKTAAICSDFVSRDSRCYYYRNETNLGAAGNFNRAFDLSNGEFFMWAAFDDLRASQYISKCVDALGRKPDAVMCCTEVGFIDEDGTVLDDASYSTSHPVGRSAIERVDALTSVTNWVDVYSLIRRAALSKTNGFPAIFGGDVVLTLQIALLGQVLYIPEKLWTVRMFRTKSGSAQTQTLVPNKSQRIIQLSYTELCSSLWSTISTSTISPSERWRSIVRCLLNCSVRNRAFRVAIYSDRTSPITRSLRGGKYLDAIRMVIIRMVGISAHLLSKLKAALR